MSTSPKEIFRLAEEDPNEWIPPKQAADAIRAAVGCPDEVRSEVAREVQIIVQVLRERAGESAFAGDVSQEDDGERRPLEGEFQFNPNTAGVVVTLPTGGEYRVEDRVFSLIPLLDRLAFLLGLSDLERQFLRAISGDPKEEVNYIALADWLMERERDKEAQAMRRLVPQTGDVFVFRADADAQHGSYLHLRAAATTLADQQKLLGREVFTILLPHGMRVDQWDAEEMRRAGWVRIG